MGFFKFLWVGSEEKEDRSGVATFSYKGIEVSHRFECIADALDFKHFVGVLYNNGYSEGLDAAMLAIKSEISKHKANRL